MELSYHQRVQNKLVRLVTKSPPFNHSIPLLRSFHWWPVWFRILFKINLLTYKTLRGKQPVYLHSMLAASIPSRSLRSNNDSSLSVPRVKTNTGARAFRSCAPSLWNNLPLSVNSAASVAHHHHYVPSVVNRSAVMDLHRSRSCATLIQSLYDIFVHSLMLSVHIVLGLPRPLLPFILPSISNRCIPSPLIICPKY